MGNLLSTVAYGFGINAAAFCVAAPLQTEKFYDLTGSLTYIFLTLQSLSQRSEPVLRNKVNSALVCLWAARLGSFLFMRIMKDGKDRRFDKVKTNPRVFFTYWMIQGLWCVLTALPVQIINSQEPESDPKGSEVLGAKDFAGWALWIVGFLLQVTADRQKSAFREIPANKSRFITTGVWSWCRFPNYFGEMSMWAGLWLSSSSQMAGLQYLSILCPIFNIFLLTRVSGIPLLDKHAKKTWGSDPVWQEYMRRTNVLFPNPFAVPVNLKSN